MSGLAVEPTLRHLRPLLPTEPARILEVGCGRGALAAALQSLGHLVTGVDRDRGMVDAAAARGVRTVLADVNDLTGEYDIVLFTRSLHHADDLDGTLAHAVTLLAPGGRIVVEEFAWERVDDAAAEFHYSNRSLLVAADALRADTPADDLLPTWISGHFALHRGADMLAALDALGATTTVETSMLWRLVDGRGGEWTAPPARIAQIFASMLTTEERRIAAGTLPAVGLLLAMSPTERPQR